jgi:hypothetical protein
MKLLLCAHACCVAASSWDLSDPELRLWGRVVAQVCCVVFAAISAYGACKTFRDGLYLTDARKVPGATPRILVAGMWFAVGVGFLVLGFIVLPTRSP